AVECVETFSFDEVVTCVCNTTKQRHHLCVSYFAAFRFRQEAATPVIGTKRFRVTAGPNLNATITNHRQFHALSVYFAEGIAEIVCRPARPVEKHINADELFLRRLLRACGTRMRLVAFAVFPCFQNLRRLSESFDNSFRKLLRPDLLLTDFLII